jgi:Fe-S-cluster-containing hydrogenase component 2
VTSERRSASQTKEFDELGLAWGQSLMVIDLDRCTRCNECVKACVDAHDDGRTRLYLDGPRFENKYLIPVTCRKCLDPVCMIGCPVGAINRGGSGEIQIADHCIGCSKCADQCPYGSIQMDLLDTAQQISPDLQELLGPGFSLRTAQEKAVVCDQCSSTPTGQPSCVYACPHDAAVRVEGLLHFNSQQV